MKFYKIIIWWLISSTFIVFGKVFITKTTTPKLLPPTTLKPLKLIILKLSKCNEKYFTNHINFTNFNIKYDGEYNEINFDMDVRETIPTNFTLVFHTHKCLGMNDLGCSQFYMVVAGKICSHLREASSIWYKFAQHFSVPIETCPLNNGIYYLRNLKLSLDDLNTIPIDEGYHVIKAYGYVRPEIIMCLYSEVLVTVE